MKTARLCARFQRLSHRFFLVVREILTLFSNFFYVNIFMPLLRHPRSWFRRSNTERDPNSSALDAFQMKRFFFMEVCEIRMGKAFDEAQASFWGFRMEWIATATGLGQQSSSEHS
jgi:hypothetical protein